MCTVEQKYVDIYLAKTFIRFSKLENANSTGYACIPVMVPGWCANGINVNNKENESHLFAKKVLPRGW